MKKFINVICISLLACAQAHGMDHQEQLNNQLLDAAKAGNPELVKPLIDAKADVNHANKYGETALFMAAAYGYSQCLRALITAKANPNHANNWGNTALMIAAKLGHKTNCDILVEALLHLPNPDQKKKIIIFLGLNKFRDQLNYLGLGENFASVFTSHLKATVYEKNKQNFQNSIAYQKINKLEGGPIKDHFLEKYEVSKQYCSVQ